MYPVWVEQYGYNATLYDNISGCNLPILLFLSVSFSHN